MSIKYQIFIIFFLDDESKSMESNEDTNSLNRFSDSKDQILLLENQFKENINDLKTKITDLVR